MMATQPIYAGHPRRFVAAAMPQGDPAFGVAGPLVFLVEQRGEQQDRPKFLTCEEAAQLRDQLDAALRAFSLGAALAAPSERPVAAVGYPFRGHRTVAELQGEPG